MEGDRDVIREKVNNRSIVLNLHFKHEVMRYFSYLKIRQRIFKLFTQEEMQTEDHVNKNNLT